MAPTSINITYAAHTASCTFLLDSEGICRRIVLQPKSKRREAGRTAVRCVGAQYVASLDGSAAGGLVEMPRVGAAMLFARVDERGRVSLVRTGVVTAFESQAAEDPFVESESQSVETSAPELLAPHAAPQELPHDLDGDDDDDDDLGDPDDYFDPSERTQRIHALRPEEIAAALGHDLATSEYHAAEGQNGEHDFPRNAPSSAPSRGMLPRRSDPHLRAAARAQVPDSRPPPPAYASDVQLARRGRSG